MINVNYQQDSIGHWRLVGKEVQSPIDDKHVTMSTDRHDKEDVYYICNADFVVDEGSIEKIA